MTHFERQTENHILHIRGSLREHLPSTVANVENAGFKDGFEMREANQDEPSVLPGRKGVHPVIFLALLIRPG